MNIKNHAERERKKERKRERIRGRKRERKRERERERERASAPETSTCMTGCFRKAMVRDGELPPTKRASNSPVSPRVSETEQLKGTPRRVPASRTSALTWYMYNICTYILRT